MKSKVIVNVLCSCFYFPFVMVKEYIEGVIIHYVLLSLNTRRKLNSCTLYMYYILDVQFMLSTVGYCFLIVGDWVLSKSVISGAVQWRALWFVGVLRRCPPPQNLRGQCQKGICLCGITCIWIFLQNIKNF